MLKFQPFIIFLIALLSCFTVRAEEVGFISDDLTTVGIAGPGEQYRILGTVVAGEKVIIVDNSNPKYTLLRNDQGKQFWLPADKISIQPSFREQIITAREQIDLLNQQLTSIDETWQEKTATMQNDLQQHQTTIMELQEENNQLQNELATALNRIDEISLQLSDKQRNIILQWFMYGGSVAGSGLLLGLFLAILIMRPRAKKHWLRS